MLILTRKIDQGVVIRDPAGRAIGRVIILGVERDRVKLGFAFAEDYKLARDELMGVYLEKIAASS